MNPDDFIHLHAPGTHAREGTLLLLHGTGGNESDLLSLGRALSPGAALLSPRGKISEAGAPRFFRRFAEGVLDVEDWKRRSHELADFVTRILSTANRASPVTAVGFSNGANIAQGLLLLRPEVLTSAILIRPMFITEDLPPVSAAGRSVLILAGKFDPLMHPTDPERIASQLRQRGADVTLETIGAGHHLTPEDADLARAFCLKPNPACPWHARPSEPRFGLGFTTHPTHTP